VHRGFLSDVTTFTASRSSPADHRGNTCTCAGSVLNIGKFKIMDVLPALGNITRGGDLCVPL
jgi:hypothetical protein